MSIPSRFAALAVTALLFIPSVGSAQGDYFGQNKVQYRQFDFKVLKTEHFDVYYYPEEEPAARVAARMAERWYGRLSRLLVHELRGRQPLILYASGPHFRQTNTIQGAIGEGTGGVTEAFKRRIVLPLAGPLEATDHVLGHELVHAFQYDITGTNVNSNTAGALALPLWFIEGMAEYLSIGPSDAHTAMWMRDAARRERLPAIDDLDNPRYFPYRYGHALWAFVAGKYGDKAVGSLLRAGAVAQGYQEAFQAVLGVDTKELTKLWHEAEFAAYRPVAESTTLAGRIARPVIVNQTEKGPKLNASPELSPDGSKFMFFSERDLFSIDLYLAETATGKVIRKITDTATNPHFESLQFLGSAGAWDPGGTRFVVPAISKGESVLAIFNAGNGKKEREIKIEGVDEVLNPTWSQDGGRIVFSGLVGGYNDLFLYDLGASALRRLTTDSFAEMDPAFSPDGTQIAFATDRFTTKLEQLDIGEPRLAIMDLQSGAVREAGGFQGAKNIGPQWGGDGRSLFFLSDREGITNIYRLPLGGGEPVQLTNLVTGVSGITELSPAMSAAGGRLIFSAYEDDGYNVYALETETQLAGTPLVDLPGNPAVLPPRTSVEGAVATALESATLALPPEEAKPEEEPYRPKLTLDFAGQPTVAVGADPFGTYAAGGVSFLFSDMLGNHTVGVSAQVTSRFDEFGGGLFYLNRSRRWNYGIGLDQTPYVSRGFQAGVVSTPEGDVYVENEFRILQTDRSLSGVVAYPFSRASRVEVSGGLRQIGLKQDVRSRTFALPSGTLIDQRDEDLGSFEDLNLGQASAALVYDTSIFGATSPIRGSRYRLEYSQSAGSLTYSGLLADVRTYVMPVRPVTFALRGLYYGRYGSDSENERLPAMYLGYAGLVRGYDPGSFESGECGIQPDGSCPAFDRLIGSKIALANVEMRVPLWSLFGGDNFYGPLPVELALFGDAGVAWGRGSRPSFAEGDREPVTSIGAAIRANAFGFAVVEIDYVKPLNRDRGWLWQFSLRPGF
ncbi:MAG TPA: BamA/TamA family outer membrane protein [Vicinamibacterales bacterium]|nr:BamA/TamA family outer membrane protein [Vicinamibacterales bacterium]